MRKKLGRDPNGRLDEILHTREDVQFRFDGIFIYSGACSNNHTLRRDHTVVAGGGIIVKDTGNKSHEADYVIGRTFKQDAADRHVAIASTVLVW